MHDRGQTTENFKSSYMVTFENEQEEVAEDKAGAQRSQHLISKANLKMQGTAGFLKQYRSREFISRRIRATE